MHNLLAVFSEINSIHQKDLNLGQCPNIDNRKSLSKFDDLSCILLPGLYFTDRYCTGRSVKYSIFGIVIQDFLLITFLLLIIMQNCVKVPFLEIANLERAN